MLQRSIDKCRSLDASSSGSSDEKDGASPSNGEKVSAAAANLLKKLDQEIISRKKFDSACELHQPQTSVRAAKGQRLELDIGSEEIDEEDLFSIDTAGSEQIQGLPTCVTVEDNLRSSVVKPQASRKPAKTDQSLNTSPIFCEISLAEGSYVDMGVLEDGIPRATRADKRLEVQLGRLDELMKKAVITPGFEKKDVIPAYSMSERQRRRMRKAERSKSKGSGWFGMTAPEVTDELKADLQLMQMRDAVYPKRNYRANDSKLPPKFFQVGTVVEDAADFYSSRLPKKERKKTIVDELLADEDFRRQNKMSYREVMLKRARPPKHHKRKKPRVDQES